MKPSANYGLGVFMLCQYKFIFGKKYTTLVGDDENGGGYAWMRSGDIWEISASSTQFCYKPKAALKNKIKF